MFDRKLKIREKLKPSRLPARQSCLRLQIPQRCVISEHSKRTSDKIVSPLPKTEDQREELAISGRVVRFRTGQRLTQVLDWMPPLVALVILLKDRSYCKITRITNHTRRPRPIKQLQYRGSHQTLSQGVEGSLLRSTPGECNILTCKLGERSRYGPKATNETSVVVA